MEKIKRLAQEHLDGLSTGEEFYLQFFETLTAMCETAEADERMAELARQLVK